MAKKSISNEIKNELKREGRSAVKRNVKKGVKSAAKEAFGNDKGSKKNTKKRGLILKILPYFLVVFALILAIFFVTVHIFSADAGFLGNFIQYAFVGLFGGASVLFPIALGYFGVRWCIYNIKWKEEFMDPDCEEYDDYKKAKRRIIMIGIMAFLVILTISCLLAVIFAGADVSEDFDIVEMWEEGGEELLFGGGGVLGGTLGGLLVAAIKDICSIIVLVVLLIVFSLLMLGLTPDYVISKIHAMIERQKEIRAARKEEEEAQRALEAERYAEEENQRQEQAQKQLKTAATADQSIKIKYANERPEGPTPMSANDIVDITNDDDDIVIEPIPNASSDPVKDMLKDDAPVSRENGGDFGGEVGFDADDEFDPLDDFLSKMDFATGEIVEDKPKEPTKENVPKDIDLSEIESDEIRSDMAAVAPDEGGEEEEPEEPPTPYIFPPIDMLAKNKNVADTNYNEELQANARLLVSTLQSFKINIKEVNYSRGPTITRYELRPEAGVRVRSIANLVDDISLNLATSGVRIEAPIPGKPAVGIEVPNKNRATVYLRDLIDNSQFSDAKSKLTAALGMDVGGNPIYFDISKMPHMLIAGATGMGKSVCINCVIISLLYKARPEDLKLILIDPKKVEFNIYRDIPHLYAPIVSDPKKAAGALASAVAEMERRFEMIEEVGVRDIASYNAATENDPYKEHMPHMVIIIDELADLMMTAPDEVETAICRLAQKARAAGIHIIIGTQRPSVDVITGLIKANIPSRIACTVASQVDSRTIIDIAGAEKLIGRGDMLFAPVGAAKPMRVQGAFVSDSEVENIVSFIRDNNSKAKYNAEFINRLEEEAAKCGMKKSSTAAETVSVGGDDGTDSKFQAAVKLAVEEGKISTSLMQRRLGVGYGRAAKIIDTMEEMGYVSKPDGNKPRRVLLSAEEYARRVTEGTLGGSDE